MAEPLTAEDLVPQIRVIRLGTSSAIVIPKRLANAVGFSPGVMLRASEFSSDGFMLRKVPPKVETMVVRQREPEPEKKRAPR